jgi:hypothetical protein
MKPEYMMASTPQRLCVLQEGTLAGVPQTGVNEDAMKQSLAHLLTQSEHWGCMHWYGR